MFSALSIWRRFLSLFYKYKLKSNNNSSLLAASFSAENFMPWKISMSLIILGTNQNVGRNLTGKVSKKRNVTQHFEKIDKRKQHISEDSCQSMKVFLVWPELKIKQCQKLMVANTEARFQKWIVRNSGLLITSGKNIFWNFYHRIED